MNLKNFITPIGEQNDFDTILTPSNFLDQLSSEQKQAVTDIVNNQIISAGAGSGKTRVLTYKIAYINIYINYLIINYYISNII